MFTVLRKNFGGRIMNRYFKSWETARSEMLKDIDDCCNDLHGKVTKRRSYFNSSKGFYVYEQEAEFENGETCHWSLIDECFEDE